MVIKKLTVSEEYYKLLGLTSYLYPFLKDTQFSYANDLIHTLNFDSLFLRYNYPS